MRTPSRFQILDEVKLKRPANLSFVKCLCCDITAQIFGHLLISPSLFPLSFPRLLLSSRQ